MNINITFIYDDSCSNWIYDRDCRAAFCNCARDYLMEKYEATQYLHLVDICNYFGARCPIEWQTITFANVTYRPLIEFQDHGEFVMVHCTCRKRA